MPQQCGGAACKATPDTATGQVADEHFKVRFRTFEIGSEDYFFFLRNSAGDILYTFRKFRKKLEYDSK